MDKTQDIVNMLKMYNQEHIINLLNKLDEQKKWELIDQISKIDFLQIMELYDNTKKEVEIKENKIEAIKYLDKEKLTDAEIAQIEDTIKRKTGLPADKIRITPFKKSSK